MNAETGRHDARPTAPPDDAQQIKRALQLAIAQIDMSLRESGESVEQVTGAITSLSGALQRIRSDLHKHTPDAACVSDCDEASEHIRRATIAFQFYDRMSQRLAHIIENLAEIATVVSAPEGEHAGLWENLQRRMRQVYTQEQEQAIHMTLHEDLPTEDVNRQSDSGKIRTAAGDIELF